MRNFTYTALTLRVKASGESNRESWFLTSGEGVLRATVFGGPKSRMRALVTPFHSGRLLVYHDPVRDSRKVSDFDVLSYRMGIRELWERTMAANAVAETILASHGGGGSWEQALSLAESVLDALDGANADTCSRLGVFFLWHWAEILGLRPDLGFCAVCGKDVGRSRTSERSRSNESADTLWYSAAKDGLCCDNCRKIDAGSWLRVDPGARLWLARVETLSAEDVERVSLDVPSFEQARSLSIAILAEALGKTLPTWDGI